MDANWCIHPALLSSSASHPNSGDAASASHTDANNGANAHFNPTPSGQLSSSGVMGLACEISAPCNEPDTTALPSDYYGPEQSFAGPSHPDNAFYPAYHQGVMGSQIGISAPGDDTDPGVGPIEGLKRDAFLTEPAQETLEPIYIGGSHNDLLGAEDDSLMDYLSNLDWSNPGLRITSSQEPSADEAPSPIEVAPAQKYGSGIVVENSSWEEGPVPEGDSSLGQEESPEEALPAQQANFGAVTFEDSLRMAQEGYQPGLRYSSVEEARRDAEHWEKVEYDETLPATMEHKRVLVAMLVWAFWDTTSCEDTGKVVEDIQKGKWSQETIELTCWELLEKLILRHERGASFTPEHARKATGVFQNRFEEVLAALKRYKALCKHLLDPVYLVGVVDDPAGAARRIHSNIKVNQRKSKILSLGKEAMAAESGTKRPASGSGEGCPPEKKRKGKG